MAEDVGGLAMELLCGVLDALPSPSVLLGRDGSVVYVNPQGMETPVPLDEVVEYPGFALCMKGKPTTGRRTTLEHPRGGSMQGVLELHPVRRDGKEILGALGFFRPDALPVLHTDADNLPYESEAMRQVWERLERLAHIRATVLLTGEQGLGCEQLARALHNRSDRANKPFWTLDCEKPEEFFSSEQGRRAALEAGSCYFHRIDRLDEGQQQELLEAIRHRALDGMLWEARLLAWALPDVGDRLSEELYRRLAVMRIDVPPLRERVEDITPISLRLLRKYAALLQKDFTGFSDQAWRLLLEHDWPGNVTQLEEVIREAAQRASGGIVGARHLSLGDLRPMSLHYLRSGYSRRQITALLEVYGYSVQGKRKAAKELGIGLSTLYRILKQEE